MSVASCFVVCYLPWLTAYQMFKYILTAAGGGEKPKHFNELDLLYDLHNEAGGFLAAGSVRF